MILQSAPWSLALFGKFAAIALAAAVAAWLPVVSIFILESDMELWLTFAAFLFPIALLGSFAVGLPIALLVFSFAYRHILSSALTLFMIANLAGVMLMLTSYVVAGEEGIYVLGIPSLVAANTFALLGWFWIIRPMTAANDA